MVNRNALTVSYEGIKEVLNNVKEHLMQLASNSYGVALKSIKLWI